MKKRKLAPYVPPPGTPPLREVVRLIDEKTKRLGELDDQIMQEIITIEHRLTEMGIKRVLSVKLPDGADLGWSLNRRRGYWRLVIRFEDAVWDLRECARDERAEVFACGAMEKLVA